MFPVIRNAPGGKGGRCIWLTTYHHYSAVVTKTRNLNSPGPLRAYTACWGRLYLLHPCSITLRSTIQQGVYSNDVHMNFLTADMLCVLLETNLLFVANSFMTYGRAACAVISKETRLNPSPSTVILIAVLSGSVSVTSVEYGYGTFKYVITTSSNVIMHCLLSTKTPLPLVPFTVTFDLELFGDRLRSWVVLVGLQEIAHGIFIGKYQVDHSATYSVNSSTKQLCVLCGMTKEVLAFEYIRFNNLITTFRYID